jgi:hypothetical protein
MITNKLVHPTTHQQKNKEKANFFSKAELATKPSSKRSKLGEGDLERTTRRWLLTPFVTLGILQHFRDKRQ